MFQRVVRRATTVFNLKRQNVASHIDERCCSYLFTFTKFVKGLNNYKILKKDAG